LIFSFVYILSFAKSKRLRNDIVVETRNGRVSPSVAIVDSVGGENNALPLKEFLNFVFECSKQSPYSVKGDINE
jgi:hypothetical protein